MIKKDLFKKEPKEIQKGNLTIKKVFVFEEEKWKTISPSDFFNISIGDLWDERVRIIIQFIYNKHPYYLAGADEDFKGIREKYPEAVVIHIRQIFRFFNGFRDLDGQLASLPETFKMLRYFPGTKIMDIKNNIDGKVVV